MKIRKLLIAAAAFLAAQTAGAATCSLNIEQAYQTASARGWQFKCTKGVLHFDNRKRPGCRIKPVIPGAWEEGRFLSNAGYLEQNNDGRLKNGWRVSSFEMVGGSWTHGSGRGTATSRVHFSFSAPMGKFTGRYLNVLKVTKSGGSCSNVYDEAF